MYNYFSMQAMDIATCICTTQNEHCMIIVSKDAVSIANHLEVRLVSAEVHPINATVAHR